MPADAGRSRSSNFSVAMGKNGSEKGKKTKGVSPEKVIKEKETPLKKESKLIENIIAKNPFYIVSADERLEKDKEELHN